MKTDIQLPGSLRTVHFLTDWMIYHFFLNDQRPWRYLRFFLLLLRVKCLHPFCGKERTRTVLANIAVWHLFLLQKPMLHYQWLPTRTKVNYTVLNVAGTSGMVLSYSLENTQRVPTQCSTTLVDFKYITIGLSCGIRLIVKVWSC
jgi:hypothetical protein